MSWKGTAGFEWRSTAEQLGRDAAARREGRLVRDQLEVAAAVAVDAHEYRLRIRRDDRRAHPAATLRGVAVHDFYGLPLAQRSGYDVRANDEDVAFHPPIEARPPRLHEKVGRFRFHLRLDPDVGPGTVRRDVVVVGRLGRLQPVSRVALSRVPGVGQLHAQRAARVEAARSDRVGDGPGAVVAGDPERG